MTEPHPPATLAAALDAGFRKLEQLPEEIRRSIEAHDRDGPARFAPIEGVCGPEHSGPCSTTDYPKGVRKICFCNAARQCDDCVFKTG